MYLPPATGANSNLIANWPNWWMDGQAWPADGEIDVVEGLGGLAQFHMNSTMDQPAIGFPGTGQGSSSLYGWHKFGCNWVAGQIDYYYDGAFVGSITTGITTAPMYLILGITTGLYSGPIVAPSTVLVDWVSVWTPGPARTVPAMSTLVDDFSSSSTLDTLWTGSASATISGGSAVLPCDSSYNGGLSTGTVYNLTGSAFSARMTMPSPIANTENYLMLTDEGQQNTGSNLNSINWFVVGSTSLTASITQAGTTTTVGSLTYSATAHAYWRIRESGGAIHWDTSPDGTTWTTQFSHSYTMTIAGLYPFIYTGYDGTGTNGNLLVSHVNTSGTISGSNPGSLMQFFM
jgi:hypothetical protein